MSNLKKTVIAIVGIIGAVLILLAKLGLSAPSNVPKLPDSKSLAVPQAQTDEVKLVSTNPAGLDEGTVSPTQTIEINFSQSAQNVPELKIRINPVIDLKIELSGDRKTVKITPKNTFGLQQGYTLVIPAEAKFDGNRTLGKDLIFHFQTIKYSGV